MKPLPLGTSPFLRDWNAAGLLHLSLVRLVKIATIDAELIDRVFGKLSSAELGAAGSVFHRVFSAWVR